MQSYSKYLNYKLLSPVKTFPDKHYLEHVFMVGDDYAESNPRRMYLVFFVLCVRRIRRSFSVDFLLASAIRSCTARE